MHVCGNAANLWIEKKRFFLHNNRSQFPEEKIAFVFCPPDWLHFHDVQGVYLVQQNYTPRRAGSHRAVIADMVISCFLHFYFIPFLSYSPVPSLQTSSSSCSLFPLFPLLLPSFNPFFPPHSSSFLLPPSFCPFSLFISFLIKTSSFQWSKGFLLLSNIK